MTKPSAVSTGQLLQQYIANHEKNVQSFAKAVGVGTASVYRWFGKHGPRSNVVRVVVEMRTGGRIKAEMWPTPGSRWGKAKMKAAKAAKKKITKKLVKKKDKNSKKILNGLPLKKSKKKKNFSKASNQSTAKTAKRIRRIMTDEFYGRVEVPAPPKPPELSRAKTEEA